MSFDLYEIASCLIYVLLWCFALGALTLLCKDGITSIWRKFQSWRRYRGYRPDLDPYNFLINYPTEPVWHGQAMLEEKCPPEMIDPNTITDDEMEEQHRQYLENKDCLIKNFRKGEPALVRTLCHGCIMVATDMGIFIKAISTRSDEPCFRCGHLSGEEFPDNKEEQ